MNQQRFGAFDPLIYAVKKTIYEWRASLHALLFHIFMTLATLLIIVLILMPLWIDLLDVMHNQQADFSSSVFSIMLYVLLNRYVVHLIISGILGLACLFYIWSGFQVMALDIYNGKAVTFRRLFGVIRVYPAVIATILVTLGIPCVLFLVAYLLNASRAVAMSIAMLAMIVINTRLIFASCFVIDGHSGVFESLRRSYAITSGVSYHYYIAFMTLGLAHAALSFIVQPIGQYIALFLLAHSLVFMYRRLNN